MSRTPTSVWLSKFTIGVTSASNSMHLIHLGHLPMSKTSKNIARIKQLKHCIVMSLSTHGYELGISSGSVKTWQQILNKCTVCWLEGTIRVIKFVPNDRINAVPLPLYCTDLAPCKYLFQKLWFALKQVGGRGSGEDHTATKLQTSHGGQFLNSNLGNHKMNGKVSAPQSEWVGEWVSEWVIE